MMDIRPILDHVATLAFALAAACCMTAIGPATMADEVISPLSYRIQLEKLARNKKHILSQKEERLLAMAGEIAGTANKAFSHYRW